MTPASPHAVFRTAIALAAATALMAQPAAADDDRPVALVEEVSDAPAAIIFDFDLLYKGDKIDLRPSGRMTISYFDNCIVETFQGGLVRIRDNGAKVSDGGQSSQSTRFCQTAALAIDTEATEAGVAVKRVEKLASLLPEEAMQEITIAEARPRFVWPRARMRGAPVHVSVYYLDAESKTVVWEADVEHGQTLYPDDAPALERGMPYEVVVDFERGSDLMQVFSIDPELALPASPSSNVIPVGL